MGYKILVVDDEQDLREIICEEIGFSDHETYKAGNGNEALEILKANPDIEIVLSDIRMPNCDGRALLQEIKKINKEKPLVYLYSGHTDYSREDLLSEGAEEMFNKPISVSNILNHIEQKLSGN